MTYYRRIGSMAIIAIFIAIAAYCASTAGKSELGESCRYQFQCEKVSGHEPICVTLADMDVCAIPETDGHCPQGTRYYEAHCVY